jgi:hypothetical protein|tara:strand:- start:189 stop:557 length:369 start_codon:yes stop_codon:yes gene_type:complete
LILVVGHSPSSKEYCPKKGNPSINRLNRWLDACGVDIYSFTNLCAHHSESIKAADIDETLIKECVKPYNKVIALGNEVAHYFKKKGIDCFHAPHPSPRNRKFNDKSYESTVINGLQKYIHMI